VALQNKYSSKVNNALEQLGKLDPNPISLNERSCSLFSSFKHSPYQTVVADNITVRMQFKALTLAALAGVVLGQGQDLTTALGSLPQLSNLTTYLSAFPDFVGQLSQLTNITLLAPNNAAFTELMNSSAGAALTDGDTSLIQALFSYHVLNGSFSTFGNTTFVPTALQPPQYTNVTGGQRVEAMNASDSVTFFSGLLQNSTVTNSTNFTNGVIHIIDRVLTVPQNISTTAVALNLTSAAGALIQADLVTTLDYLSDVTVFVPNNEAFQNIGTALPNLTMEEVTSILTYHVVNGTVGYSTSLMNGTSLTTLQGSNLTVYLEDDRVFVNSAEVVIPNVLVANGVVHVIDNVLNPMNATATADPNASTQAPAFPGASSASDVPYTSGVAQPTSAVATSEATAAASSSSEGVAMPMKTGAVGAAALFGGAAAIMNL
jgi:uncharacterized surface protein with fasciclin (FAS1) repeats